MPAAKYVSLLCRSSVPLRQLAVVDPATVAVAVAAHRSETDVLKWLGYNSEAARRDQLRDAVAYFGWNTGHWINPVPSDTAPVRDFSSMTQGETGGHGPKFEALVTDKIRSFIEESATEEEAGPGIYSYSNGMVLRTEPAVTAFGEGDTPPWDGLLVHEAEKKLWVFEVKASMKLAGKMGRQLERRDSWVEAKRSAGWTVQVVVVIGIGAVPLSRAGTVRDLRAAGVWLDGFTQFDSSVIF